MLKLRCDSHSPLETRLNNELNCSACGLYCKKLHKRPRPKTMRSSTQGETCVLSTPRPEPIEIVGTTRYCSLSTKAPPFPEIPSSFLDPHYHLNSFRVTGMFCTIHSPPLVSSNRDSEEARPFHTPLTHFEQ